MAKIKAIGILMIVVVTCYVVLALFIGFLADQTVATNTALDVAHNMTRYPGTSGFLLFTPWLMYFVPAILGIIFLVIILRRKEA